MTAFNQHANIVYGGIVDVVGVDRRNILSIRYQRWQPKNKEKQYNCPFMARCDQESFRPFVSNSVLGSVRFAYKY